MKRIVLLALGAILLLLLLACRQKGPAYPTLGPETPVILPAAGSAGATLPPSSAGSGGQDPVGADAPKPPPGTPGPVIEEYTVRPGDNLGSIAARFDLSIQDLMEMNGLTDPNRIAIGQVLKLRLQVKRVSPGDKLIPDSEMVYSPSYLGFDVAGIAAKYGGYLNAYTERVDGTMMSGPQIIQLVAERYSVGPRILLALLEWQSSWVTGQPANASQRNLPFGFQDGNRTNLYHQASLAANTLNEGYYSKLSNRNTAMTFRDRSKARVNEQLNPGSAGLQFALARTLNWDVFLVAVGNGDTSFISTYHKLFGDPFAAAIDPLVPTNVKQPTMRLPWSDGKTWYFTGGPHGGWDSGSGNAAIDFAPRDQAGTCWTSIDWAIAATPGTVVRAEIGRVLVSLEGDDFASPGWSLLYMHMAKSGRVAVGAKVQTGDHIGHPSCEGGAAETSHLHFARRYNGQWIPIDDANPLVLSGWKFEPGTQQYDGSVVRGGEKRDSCNCRREDMNAIVGDAGEANN